MLLILSNLKRNNKGNDIELEFDDVFRQIEEIDQRRKLNENNTSASAKALKAGQPRSGAHGRSRGGGTRGGGRGNISLPPCEHCGGTHKSSTCWLKYPNFALNEWRKQHSAEIADFQKKAHIAQTSESHDSDNASVYSSFMAKACVEGNVETAFRAKTAAERDPRWFLDSAASIHMTHQSEVFIEPLRPTRTAITLADGSAIKAVGVGKISLPARVNGVNHTLHIDTVYYCPELNSNLLSLGAIKAKEMT